ncbi:MAG: L,D-transpeptidase family protein, partial [Streptosporangiales bacterium]|nr:L,D-transpeptidase family protein [Streptosporangiales bacterium]
KEVRPDKGITVSVKDGTLQQVKAADADGDAVAGKLSADRRTWKSTWTLATDTKYTVSVTAKGGSGTVTKQGSFATLEPERTLESGAAPLPGEKVGVGMPIVLFLSHEVSDKYKPAVERALQVKASKPQPGSWYWATDKEVQFRTKEYWKPDTEVTFTAHLAGVYVGKDRYGDENRVAEFTVGDEHIAKVDAKKHRMKVYTNGELDRTVPVSLGKPGHDTTSGVHIALEKNPHMVMDSATTGCGDGCPGSYRTPTDWNVRITYSGEFVHSAPWSTGSQGSANVSHGCVNASPSNAKWFYDRTNRGDVVEVTGTTRDLDWGNGWTPWIKSWKEWQEGSSLKNPVIGASGIPGQA